MSAEQLCYNFDTYDSLRQWLHMVRKSQLDSGEIPGIVPTTGWGYAWGNGIVWDDVLVELPYQLYRFYGKREIVNENIEAIWRYLGYMKEKENTDGLFAYGLGDWCEAASVSEDACQTPLEVTASLTAIDLLEKAAFLFEVAGQDSRVEKAKKWQQEVRDAFRKKYVMEYTVNCLTQTAQAMALALDIFTTEEKDIAYQALLKLIRRDNSRFCVGIVGMKYLFDVLSEFGDSALALKLIADPAFPSYGYLIEKGATTLWEAFHDYEIVGDRIERKDKKSHITSFNHHFFGSVSAWFYQRIAGLFVISATELKIAPCLDCGLEWAEAEYHNEYGHIRVSWKRDGETVMLKVDNHGFKGCVEARFACEEKVSAKLVEGIYSSVLNL